MQAPVQVTLCHRLLLSLALVLCACSGSAPFQLHAEVVRGSYPALNLADRASLALVTGKSADSLTVADLRDDGPAYDLARGRTDRLREFGSQIGAVLFIGDSPVPGTRPGPILRPAPIPAPGPGPAPGPPDDSPPRPPTPAEFVEQNIELLAEILSLGEVESLAHQSYFGAVDLAVRGPVASGEPASDLREARVNAIAQHLLNPRFGRDLRGELVRAFDEALGASSDRLVYLLRWLRDYVLAPLPDGSAQLARLLGAARDRLEAQFALAAVSTGQDRDILIARKAFVWVEDFGPFEARVVAPDCSEVSPLREVAQKGSDPEGLQAPDCSGDTFWHVRKNELREMQVVFEVPLAGERRIVITSKGHVKFSDRPGLVWEAPWLRVEIPTVGEDGQLRILSVSRNVTFPRADASDGMPVEAQHQSD